MSVCVCVDVCGVGGGVGHSYSCEERDFIYMCASLMEIFSLWFRDKVNICVEGFSEAAVTKLAAVNVKIN